MSKVQTVLIFVTVLMTYAVSAASDDIEVDDMIFTKEQYNQNFKDQPAGKNGLVATRLKDYRWPNKTVPIVWDIFLNREYRRAFIEKSKIISDQTCVKFLYVFNVKDYPNHIFVRNNTFYECKSRIGFHNMGRQIMEMSPRCNVLHELLHILGFFHMHQSANRDDWIEIKYDNIIPDYKKYFDKANPKTSLYNTTYDYLSILHYSQYAFSKKFRELKTIIPLDGDKNTAGLLGQQYSWSAGDKRRVNTMYKCPPISP